MTDNRMSSPQPPDDALWQKWHQHWSLRPGTIYLNHGSFGPPPDTVRQARRAWIDALDEQPMDFFYRQAELQLCRVREHLAVLLATSADHLVLVENATLAMNIVARSVKLSPGDEVLLSNHEYGAVRRIWERAAREADASVRTVELPLVPDSGEAVVAAFQACMNERTRLLVCSHITSPTALIMPVQALVAAATRRGIATCIDGPHAIGQLPVGLDELDCDFYTASCHKWLCAPFGSGFLYVHPRQQARIVPPVLSWGRLLPGQPEQWYEEFTWTGTRDPSAYLAIPTAIEFMQEVGTEVFRHGSHELACYGQQLIERATGIRAEYDIDAWHGSMVLAELPPGDSQSLRDHLWYEHQIEIPVVPWEDRRLLRISCHVYNRAEDLERLAAAIARLVP